MEDSHQTSSIVEYFGEHNNYKCGYCNSPDTNCSHGMWAHTLTVQDYQDLIDRGWRRSGKYCYKPTMTESCCPAYTVRCRVADFKASRSQRKVLRRAAAYMRTGHIPDKASLHLQQSDGTHETVPVCKPTYQGNAVHLGAHPGLIVRPSIGNCFQGDITSKDGDSDVHMISKDVQTAKKVPKPGVGADESKPHCQKAKLLRLEKWKKKQALKGAGEQVICKADSGNQAKLIEELLGDIEENPAHRLEIRLVRSRPASSDFRSSFAESHALYKRYQMTVHNDDADECDAESFSRFLIESPLQHVYKSDGCPDGYGSFHQHYLLDGKIIAVGVIDILPRCVSSVYLYYDPEYSFLSLGTYSALGELAFTRHLHSIDLNIEYYYMGYYIHSCPKMKYKGQYKPSYLLCPETYTWHALECCTPKLDATGYSRFADQSTRDTNDSTDIRKVKTLHRGQAIPYYVYQHLKPTQARKEEESVEEYAHLVGNKGTNSLLLYRA